MARVKGGGGANVGLRAALLADAIEFRDSQVRHANGDCPELEAIAGRPLSRNPALAEAMQRERRSPSTSSPLARSA